MIKRTIVGILYGLIFGGSILLGLWYPSVTVACFGIYAFTLAYELKAALHTNTAYKDTFWSQIVYYLMALSFLVPYAARPVEKYMTRAGFVPPYFPLSVDNMKMLYTTSFLFTMLAIVYTAYMLLQGSTGAFMQILTHIFAAAYVTLPFAFALCLLESSYSFGWLILAVLTVWGSDTFAYFIGSKYGKKQAFGALSPHKTQEGVLAACLSASAIYFIFGVYLLFSRPMSFPQGFCTLLMMTVLGFVTGVIAVFGDLFASAMKRSVGIKDFSNLIPGHGGLMDRLDSSLFVWPAVFFQYFFITQMIANFTY